MSVQGISVYGKSLYFPLNFVVYLKLLYKKISLLKNIRSSVKFEFQRNNKLFFQFKELLYKNVKSKIYLAIQLRIRVGYIWLTRCEMGRSGAWEHYWQEPGTLNALNYGTLPCNKELAHQKCQQYHLWKLAYLLDRKDIFPLPSYVQ